MSLHNDQGLSAEDPNVVMLGVPECIHSATTMKPAEDGIIC